MAESIIIYESCGNCGGDGLFPNEVIDFNGNVSPPVDPIACDKCSGTGRIVAGFLDEDIREYFADILDKCNDILDKLNE